MSEESRFLVSIVGLVTIAMFLYLGFSTYFDLLIYAWLCVGMGFLVLAIVYDTDMFRDLDEDLRKGIVTSWFVALSLGGIFGYFVQGIPGAGFGSIISWLSIELIDAFYILFFAKG